MPEELKEYVNDWKIKVVDVKEIDTSKIKDEQTRYFIEAIQAMYKENYEGLHRKVKMNRDNFIYAAIITGSLDLIRDLPEGDEIDMCEGMERMAERFRNEGRKEGLMKMFNLIGIGERAGSGVPELLSVWENEGCEESLIEEENLPSRTILTLSFEKKMPKKQKRNMKKL